MKVRVCNRCKTPVKRTETPEYSYYCPEHDEDLYEFETMLIDDSMFSNNEVERLKAEIERLANELNNINRLADMILERADFGSKATKAEMHSRLTSIYVYASHIKRALARTDGELDTRKNGEQKQ